MNLAASLGRREDESVAATVSPDQLELPNERRQRNFQMNGDQVGDSVSLPIRSSSMPPPSNRKTTGNPGYHDDYKLNGGCKGENIEKKRTKTIQSTTITSAPRTGDCHESVHALQDVSEDLTEVSVMTDASLDTDLFPLRSSALLPINSSGDDHQTQADCDDDGNRGVRSQEDFSEQSQQHLSDKKSLEQGCHGATSFDDDEDYKFETEFASLPYDETSAQVIVPIEKPASGELKEEEDQVKANDTRKAPVFLKEPNKHEDDDEMNTCIHHISLQEGHFREEKVKAEGATLVVIDHSMGEKDLKIARYSMTTEDEQEGRGSSGKNVAFFPKNSSNGDHSGDDLELGGDHSTSSALPPFEDNLIKKSDMGDTARVIRGSSWPRLGQRRERVRSEAMRLASQPGAEYVRGRAPGQIPSWIIQSYRESSRRLQEEVRQRSIGSNLDETHGDLGAVDAWAVLPSQVQLADCTPAEDDRKHKKGRWWSIAVLLLALAAAAIGVGIGLSDGIDSAQQQAPTVSQHSIGPTIYYTSIECDAANRTSRSSPPNVLSQCYCNGTIQEFSSLLKERYLSFQQALTPMLVMNGFDYAETSCAPSNIALWFLVEDNIGTPNATTTVEQRYVLALHYLLLNGGTWYNATGWFSSLPECEWQGITCNADGQLNSMELSTNNLTGFLPSAIGLLSTMQVLDLSVNHLSGSIPTQIASLTKLSSLELSNNHLSGTLPAHVNNLIDLQSMHLNLNGIHGTLPKLTGLTQLSDLQLTGNYLSGKLPSRDGFPESLRNVAMDSNLLTGNLNSFQGMTSLVSLNLNNNSFVSDDLPASFWAKLTSLETLALEHLHLHGPVADLFQNLKDLVSLDLTGNNFTGTLPTEIGEFKDLAVIVLSSNQLSGQIPTVLALCTSARQIDLSSNQFVGTVPTELGELSNLSFLYFNGNHLTGTMPQQVCSLRARGIQDLEADCSICPDANCCNYCTR